MELSRFVNSRIVLRALEEKVNGILQRTGIFYRLWLRFKTDESINNKVENRKTKGILDYKIQDFVGCRIVCYFDEDVPICEELLGLYFKELTKDRSIDEPDSETFKPVRRNYVFELPDDIVKLFDAQIWDECVDKTFECQFRSVFSEGWHEVEHDLRYKSQQVWDDQPVLSRKLNAILATFETSEWALLKIFDDLAYHCYKEKKWDSMIKNKLRLRFKENDKIDSNIIAVLNSNSGTGKKILGLDKFQLIKVFAKYKFPITLDNVVYLVNHLFIKDQQLLTITPPLIIKTLMQD